MSCTPEEREFVSRHVAEFTKRHWKKLNQVFPAPELEDTIKESGNTDLIEAAAYLDHLDSELEALENKRRVAIQDFENAFASVVDSLMCNACTAHSKTLQEKQESFDYQIRTAIGLVELVSSEDAYEILENCRRDIEDLGKD